MTRAWVSSCCVALAALMSAIHLLEQSLLTTVLSGLFLGAFFVLEWSRLIFAARALLAGSLGLFLLLWLTGRTTQVMLADGIDRAAFLTFFVVALGVLRDASMTSKLVRTCGQIIVNQTPGRRYLTLTLGGHLMGILMSFGAINLLGTMVKKAVPDDAQAGDPRIRAIRLQRMSLAVLRGFCAVPLWAPTSVTFAILLSSSLELTWVNMLPYGVTATLLFLGLGWALDRLTFPRPKLNMQSAVGRPFVRPFAGLVGIVVLVPITGAVLARQLDLDLISGLLIAIPFIGVGWIFIQMRHWGLRKATVLTGRRIIVRMLPSFRETRSEIAIFAASGFLGIVLLPQIDVALLGAGIAQLGLGEGAVLIAGSWVIILLALLSVNPLVSTVLVIETLVALPGLVFAHEVIALMITMSWAIVVSVSPFSASTRLLGRCIGHDPFTVGLRWNLLFVVCAVLMLDVALLLLV